MRLENDVRLEPVRAEKEKIEQDNRPVSRQQQGKAINKQAVIPAPIEAVDQFIPSAQVSAMPPKGYGYSQLGEPSIKRLKFGDKQPLNDLRNLVRRLLEGQGLIFKELAGLDGIFIVDEQARIEAALAISDTGPLGIQVLSNKIALDAQAFCGHDKGQLANLSEAIESGFADAVRDLGGQLLELNQKTRDMALAKLASWAKT